MDLGAYLTGFGWGPGIIVIFVNLDSSSYALPDILSFECNEHSERLSILRSIIHVSSHEIVTEFANARRLQVCLPLEDWAEFLNKEFLEATKVVEVRSVFLCY